MNNQRTDSVSSSSPTSNPRAGELGTASALKPLMASVLASHRAGQLIGALTGKRIRHRGIWFDTRSSDFIPEVRAQMFWGIYEGAETRMIHRFLRDSTAVVELGSSLGITAAHIAAVMAEGGHLTCVEANPRLLPGLRERISKRVAHLRVDVIHAAIADHCGTAVLTIAAHNLGSSLQRDPRANESTVRVPALTLAEVIRQRGLTEFDLVSDIEGGEAAFLLQDPSVLKNCRRAVIELHDTSFGGQKASAHDLLEAAVSAGFQVIGLHGPVVALARP
jgi:FkbM family methyltransferase